ncbi:hypothetical protein ASG76_17345 [Nocardioides sp. Soil774]|uniref:hypothetical protein n=1 Tax=Nocardioides sp. Soil774 TaxID=1736408 RepID=UPI0006F3D90A|nr:hypothetical protein [Nocardioides sp. Soil774]KRE92222.1 hypothetical protein ASG76_17345 [Nocardioides sp. Soil774]
MTTEQVWTGAAVVLGLLVLAVLVALTLALLALRRARRAESRLAALAVRVDTLESPAVAAPRPVVEDETVGTYVITGMHAAGTPQDEVAVPVARPIDGRLFADIVARESVVKAASWTHGLRRALSAESRNRIRFEVRRETRRVGRDRRAEAKQALREFRARERAAHVADAVGEDVA